MKPMTKKSGTLLALSAALALCVPATWAQQKDPRVPPVAPQTPLGVESSSRTAPEAGANPAAEPQVQKAPPLTSAEAWQLAGTKSRNYFVPSLGFSQGGDTNPGNRSLSRGVQSASSVNGDIAFHRLSGRAEFNGTYSGGATFYSGDGEMNNWFQKMELTQKLMGRRWTLLFGDSADYRQDPFVGSGTYGGLPGGVGGQIGAQGVNAALLPSQTVATGSVARISNTAYAEWQQTASRRSSFTVTGAYGLLRYFEPGLNDTNNAYFGAGYNYAVTGRDTLALSYGANLFRYPDFDQQKTDNHTVHASYRRLITGRMVFDFGAGPQVTLMEGSPLGSKTVLSWSLQSSLAYHLQRSSLGLFYSHSTTGGSGFFLGAETDHFGATWSHPLSRLWTATWDLGYAHNRALGQVAAGNTVYDTVRGGVRIARPLGRYGHMFLNYQGEHQRASGANTCVGPGCGLLGTRHVFGIGFNFRFKPVNTD